MPAPAMEPDLVRVRVAAASVNFPDVLLVAGTYQIPVTPPFTPGSEFAGTVVEVGDAVDGVAVADRVSGTVLVGAFAEEVVVAPSSLTPVPVGVDLTSAASFGVAFRTAYHVLRSVARVGAGEQAVVLGAGGGVGLAAVQLAAHLGASVTAVASSEAKLTAATAAGASGTINHRSADLRTALRELHPDGVDVVVDPVGGHLSEPALRVCRWGARFVTVGFASGEIPRIPLNLVLLKGVQVLGFQFVDFVTHAPDAFAQNEAELSELFASGAVAPHVGAVFDLHEAAAALQLVADGQAVGKAVLIM